MTIYTGSFYFLGTARPAHFEASSIKALRGKMLKAIQGMSMDDWQFFSWRIDNIAKELRKRHCAGASHEYGTKGVSMKRRAHDPWLKDVVADFPAYPGLDYSQAI